MCVPGPHNRRSAGCPRFFVCRASGFTLIELLVVILIIGILIVVSAPSFLGQTQTAHQSAAEQRNAVAYRAARVYATEHDANFNGFTVAELTSLEPELAGKITVDSAVGHNLALNSFESGVSCTLTVSGLVLEPQSCLTETSSSADPNRITVGAPVSLAAGSHGNIISFSPDGLKLYAYSAGAPEIITVADGSSVPLLDFALETFAPPSWTQDSSQLFGPHVPGGVGSAGDFGLFDAASGAFAQAFSPSSSPLGGAAMTSDGSKVVYTLRALSSGSALFSSNSNGSSETQLTDSLAAGQDADYPVISPDGTQVAYSYIDSPGGSNTHIAVQPFAGGTPLTLATGDDAGQLVLGAISWSPDGSKIAFNCVDTTSGRTQICVVPAAGGPVTVVTDTPAGLREQTAPAWSPDGRFFAYAAYTDVSQTESDLYVIAADGGTPRDVYQGTPTKEADFAAWSPDGSKLAYSVFDQSSNDISIFYLPVS